MRSPRPALAVVADYRQGARWRPRQLTQGQAVLQLLANAVPARRDPARVLAALAAASVSMTALETKRGEAAEVAPLILGEAERAAAGLSLVRFTTRKAEPCFQG